jgi:uncharacterized OB-fold protein
MVVRLGACATETRSAAVMQVAEAHKTGVCRGCGTAILPISARCHKCEALTRQSVRDEEITVEEIWRRAKEIRDETNPHYDSE